MRHTTDNTRSDQRDAALRRYLSPETAAALLAGSPRPHDLYAACAQLVGARYAISTYLPRRLVERQLDGRSQSPWLEWVEGSLLFADISGSTALADRLRLLGREGTEIVTDTLNDFFGTMIWLIERAGGDLLTFGGDALLVLFSGPDHPFAAAATALALLGELSGFQRTVPGVGAFPLSLHIGVESGRVALVSAGQPQALRYSAMGATVNAVARAEGYGGRGELVLGPRAWAAVAPDATGEEVAPGFARLRELRRAPAAVLQAIEAAPPVLDREGLGTLAAQIDRIAPYLPGTLLERILADPMQPRVEAELRPVSVLFAQVAGLTELVEALEPPAAARAVDAFLRTMQAAIQPFGGFVNKLDLADEGDKLMVVFGAPVAYEDHAERAARAALAMMEAAAAFHTTRLRIGINTGDVFAGNVGTAERKEYTVMGDAVNVAARVMAAAAWGELLITRAAADMAAGRLALDSPRLVAAKGKAAPLELLRLSGVAALPETPAAEAPLMGRERELAWLDEQLAGAAAGRGRAARVRGEAGIGKSRLGAVLLDQTRASGGRAVGVACLSFNTSTPYAPWGDLLRELCGIRPDDGPDERAEKLGAALDAADIPADDWLPLVAELARARAADSVIVRALDPQQRQARRFDIILALLRRAAREAAPLAILFDNLHWADQVSLDLWQYVAAHIGDDPILLLGLHRGAIEWGSGPQDDGAAVLHLAELDDAASGALLAAIAPGLPPELREAVGARAAGNPLFLEELLRAVGGGQAAVDALPDSLSGLLLARLDRLDERSRALLRVASVIGQRFPVGVLQSLHPEDHESIVRQLSRLDSEALTSTERETPERVHLFRHALMQEVAYQSLLYARRRELHRRVGEHLERRYADELERLRAEYGATGDMPLVQIGRNGSLLSRAARGGSAAIFLLAHHYRLSDTPERAVPYLLLAGHTARDDYANEQAVLYYRWALEILPPGDPRSWEAGEALGDVLCTLGRYDEAQAQYAALLESAGGPAALPPSVAAEVLRSWGDALESQGRYQEALERLREAEAIVVGHLNAVPPLMLAAIHADTGAVLRRLGQYDEALDICEAGLARVRHDRRSSEDERIAADLQQQIGNIYGMRGQYQEAQFHFENALAALEAIDDLFGCARLVNNLGYLAQLQGRYEEAVGRYERAEQLARKVSALYIIAGVRLNAAYCLIRLDRYDEAAAACADLAGTCAQIGDQDGLAKSHDLRGTIAYNRGDYAAACAAYDEALAIYRALGATYDEGNTLAMLALAHAALGDASTARRLGEQAQQIAERIQMPQLIVEALIAQADADLVELRAGEPPAPLLRRAGELAERAAELADQIGSQRDYGVARRLAGAVAAEASAPFADHFAAAEAAFVATGSAFEQARTWAAHGLALRARNDPAAAAYLNRAEETFTRIGAAGELRRLTTSDERSA